MTVSRSPRANDPGITMDTESVEEIAQLPQLLARRAGLSDEDLKRIVAVQNEEDLGFIEAALRLRVITQSDLDAVLAEDGQFDQLPLSSATARASSRLVSARDPFHEFSEKIRALRTELVMRSPDEQSNVFAVVSPSAGDGRSRLAAELAVSFAQLGEPTLLVDCDLRRPSQHVLFGADNSDGLARALMDGRAPKIQAIHGIPSLFLLASGPRAATPLESLSNPSFGEMLDGWSRRYLHIVIDTPAVSEFSDALAVVNYAGRAVLVVRKDGTKLAAARDTIRRISSSHGEVIGSIINQY